MANMTAIAALKRLNKENPNVILVFGEESMLIKEIVSKYLKVNKILNNNDINFTKTTSDAIEDSLKNIINMPPMFAESRVIVIDDFEKVWSNSSLRESFNDSIKKLPNTTKLLLIDNEKPNKRIKVYKTIAKLGLIIECNEMNTAELIQWINREFKRNKTAINKQAIEYLISQVGTSMHNLISEIHKLIAYCASDKTVTIANIDTVVIPSVEAGIFACVDALGQRNIKTAYLQLKVLIENGEPPLRILAMFIRQIRLILRTKLLQEQEFSTFYIMKELSIPEFVVKKIYKQTSKFTVNELKTLLLSLNETEYKIKTGKLEAKLGLKTWLLNTAN
ncbi:DNA polymerase III subunit delta [Clostridium sp. 'deep sea']|uniref:DNA polymerase III subunit delta n=1 Tax=Clostridium sp. 'deep sea' TaxID=2779445 RepID=UPI00189696AF|nr:DNA polymerase III subunit delta [Clostridium sp. 'deep sea']QOR34335.1 DNA polymerase III subunit delta [Clostridium sp. 'deep sea']